MKTAIVILNWNGEDYLRKFLPSLIEHSSLPDVELIVADNGSTDKSLTVLKEEFPDIRRIEFKKNYGFALGYNKALFQVEADNFVILNSDVELSEGWLEPLLSYMDEHPDVAACQPKIRSYHQRDYFEYAGACGGFIDHLGYPFCRGRVFDSLEKDNGQYDEISPVFWVSGACLFIRSRLFWEVGGFDAHFIAHMEEIDLCWRLRSRMYEVVCIPQSTVFHVGGGSLNQGNPYKTYLNFRNNLLMLYKNLPSEQLRKTMFIRWGLDYIAAFQMLAKGDFKNFKSVLKARRDYKKLREKYEVKQKRNRILGQNKNIKEIFPRSILVEYYLKKKKTFTAIYEDEKINSST